MTSLPPNSDQTYVESPTSTEPEPTEAAPDERPDEDGEGKHKHHHSFWRELPVLIVIAFAIALLVKTFALQAFYIPSGSMEPTLMIGDRVLVEKVSYRFSEPDRGDVVVFEKDLFSVVDPNLEDEGEPFWRDVTNAFKSLFGFPTGTHQDFIKRVIAVEGDTVEGKDGMVLVNGEPIEESYLPDGTETSSFPETKVGQDQIFVMGDNRGNSDDSRNFGPVPVDSVVGHAFLLVWPPSNFDTL